MTSLMARGTETIDGADGRPSVVIVGGGFCGAMVAANLLRHAEEPMRIILVDPGSRLGGGAAFGDGEAEHVLNVPACRMSAWADDADHFVRWASARLEGVDRHSFLPRRLFGAYVEATLDDAVENAVQGVTFEHRRATAGAIVRRGDGALLLSTSDGMIDADEIVVAVGHSRPATPQAFAGLDRSSSRLIRDPWRSGSLDGIGPEERVLLVGTGLTMIDAATWLHRRGCRRLTAISPHGLLPRLHRPEIPALADEGWVKSLEGMNIKEMLRAVRARIERIRPSGGDWRSVLDAMRPRLATLWRSLPHSERARFLRRLAPFWDVHRHRCPPVVHAEVERMMRGGALRIVRAVATSAEERDGEVCVHVRCVGDVDSTLMSFGRVVLCTGPASDVTTWRHPLIDGLVESGLAVHDPLGLGVQTSAEGRLVTRPGCEAAIWCVGWLRRGELWESTAVPELKVQAAEVAKGILSRRLVRSG